MSSENRILIEVCVDSVESAIAAVRGDADRLELCGNLGLGGGTTPSLGLFNRVHAAVPNVPIMVMLRPRTGDFLYTDPEFEVILEDLRLFKHAGADGVVVGILHSDGSIDEPRTRILVEQAQPMQVCFHRAIDMTALEPQEALECLAQIPGITRVLTSGQAASAPRALRQIRSLLEREEALPTVLVGSGINPTTVEGVLTELIPYGLREIHLSGGSWVPGGMQFKREGMGMGVGGEGEWGLWRTSEEKVRAVRQIVDTAWERLRG